MVTRPDPALTDDGSFFTLSTRMIVRFVQAIHILVLVFVLSGWLLPFPPWLWAHVFFIPLLILHWRTNQNQCFLTQLEARLKEDSESMMSFEGASPAGLSMPMRRPQVEEGHFIKSLWKKVFGRVPSDQALEAIIYGLMAICWTLGVVHLIQVINDSQAF